MASKLQEKMTLSAQGILDLDNADGSVMIEIEGIGTKSLKDLLAKFNGCDVKFSISLNNEIFE